jgi:hypothetical protein
LVVTEKRIYKRDFIGLVQNRIQTTCWYLSDDSMGLEKSFIKYYSPSESIEEGVDRRGNIISDTKITMLTIMMTKFGQTGRNYAFDFLNSLKVEVGLFLDGYTAPLLSGINTSTKSYINSSEKAVLIDKLTI